MTELNREGFWGSREPRSKDSDLPMPVEGSGLEWQGKAAFLNKLDIVQGRSTTRIESYRGWSNCRLCDRQNGSQEYYTDQWVWPEGFMHYVEDHDVRPSLAFEEYIRRI